MRLIFHCVLKFIKSGILAMFIVLVVIGAFMEIFPAYYPNFIQQGFSLLGVEFKAFTNMLLGGDNVVPIIFRLVRLPWYSSFTTPEVGVTDAAFMNKIGL